MYSLTTIQASQKLIRNQQTDYRNALTVFDEHWADYRYISGLKILFSKRTGLKMI